MNGHQRGPKPRIGKGIKPTRAPLARLGKVKSQRLNQERLRQMLRHQVTAGLRITQFAHQARDWP